MSLAQPQPQGQEARHQGAAQAFEESGASLRPLPIPAPHEALPRSSFGSWYPRFRRHAPKATVLDLNAIQPDFIEWLEADGLVLPKDSAEQPATRPNVDSDSDSDNQDRMSATQGDEDEEEDDEEGAAAPSFPALDARIRQVIRDYDGAVFPKLNWSAPQDAAWILPGSTVRCTTPADVYLLLKSSDFVAKDLAQAHELARPTNAPDAESICLEVAPDGIPQSIQGADSRGNAPTSDGTILSVAEGTAGFIQRISAPRIELVLKKWFDMPKSHEFRCFVRNGRLVAISQRDITFYEHLQSSATRRRICSQILQFFNSTLAPGGTTATTNGAVGVGLSDYVFDAYLTRDLGRVFLVDINPFLPRTDPLLFAWEEIEEIAQAPSSVGSGVASSVPVVASVPIPSDGAGQDDANPDEVVAPRPHPAANAGDDDEESSDAASLASDEEEEEEEEEGSLDDGRLRFPLLRLLTSRAQAAQSYPTYAKNMVPSDVLNISDGAGIADFARRWAEEVAHAAVGDDASPVARLAQEGDLASRAPTRSTGEAPFDETLGPMPEH